jgi:hypothetical protein
MDFLHFHDDYSNIDTKNSESWVISNLEDNNQMLFDNSVVLVEKILVEHHLLPEHKIVHNISLIDPNLNVIMQYLIHR